MIKNTLFTLTLLIPMFAFARTTTVGKEAPVEQHAKIVGREAPIPDCLPCPGPKQDAKMVIKEAPIPDCLPCPGPKQEPSLVAREAPIPDCLPCPGPNQGPSLVARGAAISLLRTLSETVQADRKRSFDSGVLFPLRTDLS